MKPRVFLGASRGLSLTVAALCAACSGNPPPVTDANVSDGAADADAAASDAATVCRDPAALAQERRCRADEHCPCGAHCELGRCVATCRADSECAAQERCDRFGRCRPAGDPSLTAPPSATAEAHVDVSTPRVQLEAGSMSASFIVRVTAAGTTPVRVEADPGAEVRCQPSAAFASSCTISDMSSSAPRAVEVHATAAPADAASTDVRVYAGSEMEVVAVERPSAQTATEFAGIYNGTATLDATAYDGATPAFQSLSSKLVLPVRAMVFGTRMSGTIRVEDVLKGMHPEGLLIGAITEDAMGTSARFPAWVWHSGRLATNTPTEVLAEPLSSRLAVDQTPGGAGSIQFVLSVRQAGNTQGSRALYSRFRVQLERRGSLPAGMLAPSVPAAAQRSIATDGFASTPWETAAVNAFDPFDSFAADTATLAGALTSPLANAIHPSNNLSVAGCRFELSQAAAELTLRRFVNGLSTTNITLSTYNPASDLIAVPSLPNGNPLVVAITPNASGTAAPFDQLSEREASIESTRATDGVIPCAIGGSFTGAGLNADLSLRGTCGTLATTRSFTLRGVDRCTEISQQTGCVVEDVGGVTNTRTMSVRARLLTQSGCTASGTVAFKVNRICRPQTQQRCGELYSCAPRTTQTSLASLDSALASGPTVNALSGDLACANMRSVATPLDAAADTAATRPSMATVLPQCIADFARLQQAIPATPSPNGAALAALFGDPQCYDAVRALLALGWALHPARRVAVGSPVTNDERSAAHAHRLLQQWFSARNFTLREVAQRARVPAAVRGSALEAGVPPVLDVLRQSLEAWELLAHPRFASAIARLPDAVVERPDHRASLGVSMASLSATHPHGVGLSVAMLELLATQLEAAGDLVELAALSNGDRAVLTDVSRVLRLATIATTMSETLYQRAVASATSGGRTLAWAAKYQVAFERAQAALRVLIDRSATLARGGNAIGVDDADLPLYYFGDEMSATRRFSAISDYIVGSSPMSMAWAPALVTQATNAANMARAAWTAQATRQYAQRLAMIDNSNRINAALLAYGTRLTGYCGAPAGLSTAQVIDRWTNFDATRCFRQEAPQCTADRASVDSLITTDHARARFCLVRQAAPRPGRPEQPMPVAAHFRDAAMQAIAAACMDNVEVADGCGPGGSRCVRCVGMPSGPTAPATVIALTEIDGLDQFTVTQQRSLQQLCAARSPLGSISLPGASDVPNSPLDRAECYRGSLGEQLLALRRATDSIDLARGAMLDRRESYDIAMRSCYLRREGDMRIISSSRRHEEHMRALRAGQLAADLVSIAAKAANDCMDTGFFDIFPPDPAQCGLIGTAAAADATSRGLQFEMDNLKAQHDLKVQGLESLTDFRVCANDAEQFLVGLNTAAIDLRSAQNDAERALLALQNGISAADDVYNEGRAVVAGLREYASVRAPEVDLWVDESVETYVRSMRQARRATYLAVRAVEYEYQGSLDLRARVLAAQSPAELSSALADVQATAATRSINGRRPSSLLTVLSLRDDILQLADTRSASGASSNLTPAERFRALLRDRRYATYDERGTYAGQRIPFRLAPLSALGLGETGGVALFATTDCAERLWSVNASILGSPMLYRGSATTFARIDLLKSNSFFSQWCSPSSNASAFQTASVRPERNLFRDPEFGAPAGVGGSTGVMNSAATETRARIQAYFNVSRATFEQTMYANGESAESAARGLFGEYALFIPAAQISQRMPDGTYSNGLDLDAVDDVLLRLDYVSVAR